MNAKRVKNIRVAVGESAFDFCHRLKVTPYAIHKWEGGKLKKLATPSGPAEMVLELYEFAYGLTDELQGPSKTLFELLMQKVSHQRNGKKRRAATAG